MTFLSRNRTMVGFYAFLAVVLTMLVLFIMAVAQSTAGAPRDNVSIEKSLDDSTGTYGPTIGMNGKVGFGTDLGGVTISPSGKIGIPMF